MGVAQQLQELHDEAGEYEAAARFAGEALETMQQIVSVKVRRTRLSGLWPGRRVPDHRLAADPSCVAR